VKIWLSHNNSRGNYEISIESECPEEQAIIEFLERAGEITDLHQILRDVRRTLETPEAGSVTMRAREVMYELNQLKTAKPA